jgi:predicted DNA-binding transcriptional regulator YafY
VNRTESRSSAPLPPVTFTPEEAAAVTIALAARAEGPYVDAGREALEKVLTVLEPDPRRRAELLARSLRVGGHRSPAHPPGRARRPGAEAEAQAASPPRLVVLPGGRA